MKKIFLFVMMALALSSAVAGNRIIMSPPPCGGGVCVQ